MPCHKERDAIDIAQRAGKGAVRQWAQDVDVKNRFPSESIDELRKAGLLGFFVPTALGGWGGHIDTFAKIASILAEECLSTSIIWAMHCQQVAALSIYAIKDHADTLAAIASDGDLVGSVTTEAGKGGDLLRAQSYITYESERMRLCRDAPVVSYGEQASFFLITMRSGESRPETDVKLVLVKRGDGIVSVTGDWNAMGMRGTRSVPMSFDVCVDKNRAIGHSFRETALKVLIPLGHIGWSAAWLGAARGAYRRFVRHSRSAGRTTRKLRSDLFVARLAELRVLLDLNEALLTRCVDEVSRLESGDATLEAYEDVTYNIRLNNLKIAGSRLSFEVADRLVELSGLRDGYSSDGELGIERVFRDLRSAELMFNNDRLIESNGKLILVEHTGW